MTLRRGLAVTAAVLAAAGLTVTGASAATTGAITGIGGKCLDVTGGAAANGTRVQLWTCTGGGAQQWSAGADGTITALGKCLDVAGGSTQNGSAVQIYDCNGTAAQRWTADAGRLVNAGAGKCLDATGVSSVDGTPLQTWSCSTGANQQWVLPASAPAGGPCPQGPFGNPLPSPVVAATAIRDGFNFLEGPTWDAASQTLLLTNMHDGTGAENVQPSDILRFTPSTGAFTTFVAGAGSNGLALSRDGKSVYAATHDQRSVSAYDLATGQRRTIAADYQGRLFNSPNDVTEGADGTVYFTDPDFQRANRPDRMSGKTSVFRVRGGVVTLIDDTIREPNGIELSPDGKTLYVGGNATGKIYRYPVAADGSTGARSDFASLAGTDGGTVDCAGNVYQVTYGDGKVHVFSPAGQALGMITAGPNATNLAFGGPDRKTLYLTSGTPSGGGDSGNFALYSVRLNVPGWPY
ncbi:SMP-30/gluconolactonase/LRE family protein [Amycolatopsis sp., V23-08]|uniref:SMP-30/gluconolactonase/LRE family protein n=1 Tax=Amycolatopsis heterodermiae TaxID=3110235 RepID=A0ABU5R2S9_9PSEU|nr:SMP-30/gluconolactonase/LRE family protein [Amycolatopsis sp., V23-08]MEA5360468.1 SMP-30/gluconolactonase/LRE family protein [Amycolatopsis sp., V23-08]